LKTIRHSLKKFGPLRKLFATPGDPSRLRVCLNETYLDFSPWLMYSDTKKNDSANIAALLNYWRWWRISQTYTA